MRIWENDIFYMERHESDIPWVKLFTETPYKEMSDAPSDVRRQIYTILDIVEREMIAYYRPDKINIASFGNYLPHLHWHIMARFRNDAYFPEPMWGEKQRESTLALPDFDRFAEILRTRLALL